MTQPDPWCIPECFEDEKLITAHLSNKVQAETKLNKPTQSDTYRDKLILWYTQCIFPPPTQSIKWPCLPCKPELEDFSRVNNRSLYSLDVI
jgi:hypothetical protein